jgi:hypothetical protein
MFGMDATENPIERWRRLVNRTIRAKRLQVKQADLTLQLCGGDETAAKKRQAQVSCWSAKADAVNLHVPRVEHRRDLLAVSLRIEHDLVGRGLVKTPPGGIQLEWWDSFERRVAKLREERSAA